MEPGWHETCHALEYSFRVLILMTHHFETWSDINQSPNICAISQTRRYLLRRKELWAGVTDPRSGKAFPCAALSMVRHGRPRRKAVAGL
jgi:hypothetical protein